MATVAGGFENTASGPYAAVPGGSSNLAGGQYSFAAGCQASAAYDGTFVWSGYNGSSCTTLTSSAAAQFLALAPGGFAFYPAISSGAPANPVTIAATSGNVSLPGNLNVGGTTNFVGLVTFASGQTFPGAGGITGVTAGTDLTGGGTSGTVTLNLDTTKVPTLGASSNTFGGSITAASFSGSGAGLTSVPNSALTNASINFSCTGLTCDPSVSLGGTVHFSSSGGGGTITGVTAGTDLTGGGTSGTVTLNLDTTQVPTLAASLNSFSGELLVSGLPGGENAITGYGGSGGDGLSGYTDTSRAVGGYASSTGDGIYGYSKSGYAGYFYGNINVTGAITAGTKDFKIDHPLDPANRYLYHASVKSSEMMNIYAGNVILDANGEATLELPGWFEAENADFRYQLTAIGGPAPGLYIAEEVAHNRFKIAGGRPGIKVSWQVTSVRQDAYAKAHPLQVEVDKPEKERGYYIHPELYGAPPEKSIEWARNPEMMKRMQEKRQGAKGVQAKPKPTGE
jgi:hypothetical protein